VFPADPLRVLMRMAAQIIVRDGGAVNNDVRSDKRAEKALARRGADDVAHADEKDRETAAARHWMDGPKD
jgi:hypothetical protein